MSTSFDLPQPDLFTAGTVGPPGERVFYLQARGDGVVVSLRCEKQQVAALAEYLSGMLEDLPPVDPSDVPECVDLVEPVVAEWVVASLAVAWDEADDCVVLVAEEFVNEDPDEEIADAVADRTPATARLRIRRPQATAFVGRARDLVSGGRPPCRICGRPLDPSGHVCPRANGHRARR
ncbi:MAG: DUF3090 family protein [Acidimicrobiales bacterium]